MSSYKIVLIV